MVARPPSQLTTFVSPTPRPALIRALGAVNRVLCLGGIPGLRRVPLLNLIPGVQGLAKIEKIDFPSSDEARLARTVNPKTAAFMTPNHPEFFTDWMIDKEISTRVAPLMASWATHTVVNGMGRAMQSFWLANNLVAQIPGAGGAQGKAYSVQWALAGHGVLLHSEGTVGWHGDHVATLFDGALDMAIEASRQAAETGDARPVFVAPLVWKLSFLGDVTQGLSKELDFIERRLRLPKRTGEDLGARVHAVYAELLSRDATKLGATIDASASYFDNQASIARAITARLDHVRGARSAEPQDSALDALHESLRAASRWLRATNDADVADKKAVQSLVRMGQRLLRLRPEMYRAERLTQEQIAENCKRIRSDYCTGTLRDALAKFIPRPVGPRVAHIRVPEALEISREWRELATDEERHAATVSMIRRRMQDALDAVNREFPSVGPTVANPFLRSHGD